MRKTTALSLLGSIDSMIVQLNAIKLVLVECSHKRDKFSQPQPPQDDLVLSQKEESEVDRMMNEAFKLARAETSRLSETIKEELYEQESVGT